jgi:branched-chain amino acid transport system permease protein
MHLIIQAVILGIITGSVYALMASGQTLIFGVLEVINVAQGAFVVLGAYLTFSAAQWLHVDPLVTIIVTTPFMFLIGILVYLVFLRRLPRTDFTMMSLLIMFATAIGIEGILDLLYGDSLRAINVGYSNSSITLGSYGIPVVGIISLGLTAALLGALFVGLTRTRFGRAIRATVQDRTAATLLGVRVNTVSALAFGIGVGMAASAGAVFGMTTPFNGASHYDLVSRLLAIVVLGGMGSMLGAVVASMIMGVTEAVVNAAISPIWGTFTFLVVIFIVLMVRPQGLFGRVHRGAL